MIFWVLFFAVFLSFFTGYLIAVVKDQDLWDVEDYTNPLSPYDLDEEEKY